MGNTHFHTETLRVHTQMGAKGDVRMYRGGERQLVADSDLVVVGNQHVQGSLNVNGKSILDLINKAVDAKLDEYKKGSCKV